MSCAQNLAWKVHFLAEAVFMIQNPALLMLGGKLREIKAWLKVTQLLSQVCLNPTNTPDLGGGTHAY